MIRPRIRLLVVDDSALVRKTVRELLAEDPQIEVTAAVSSPFAAAERIRKETPDVILLDTEIPRVGQGTGSSKVMDGLTFLRNLMASHPIPVVVCSEMPRTAGTALLALEAGAIEVIPKPHVAFGESPDSSRERLRRAILAAADIRPRKVQKIPKIAPRLTADAVLPPPSPKDIREITEKMIVIGASTGGTEAITELLRELPPGAPGIVIVQHMPEKFTTAFADRLNGLCAIAVKEAEDRDDVVPGRALIAPGNRHTLIRRHAGRYYVEVLEGPPVCRHRPSVDVLFRSAARVAGSNAIGVILTGMGDDGARGLLEMRESGAATIAQDENTCVVFGMPKEAIERGAAGRVLPLGAIAGAMLAAGVGARP